MEVVAERIRYRLGLLVWQKKKKKKKDISRKLSHVSVAMYNTYSVQLKKIKNERFNLGRFNTEMKLFYIEWKKSFYNLEICQIVTISSLSSRILLASFYAII